LGLEFPSRESLGEVLRKEARHSEEAGTQSLSNSR